MWIDEDLDYHARRGKTAGFTLADGSVGFVYRNDSGWVIEHDGQYPINGVSIDVALRWLNQRRAWPT
jgi:hypothetical protein